MPDRGCSGLLLGGVRNAFPGTKRDAQSGGDARRDYPAVTEATIGATICRPGWTRSIRPPRGYTSAMKRRQLRALGYADRRMAHYEEDHLGCGLIEASK